MKSSLRKPHSVVRSVQIIFIALVLSATAHAQQMSLQAIVTPSTVVVKDRRPVTFAVHGFIEFKSLAELFPYVESQNQRWNSSLSENERQKMAADLLRRGVESRVISMVDERPLETLMTHTRQELQQALAEVK
jgi:hypothetical protein